MQQRFEKKRLASDFQIADFHVRALLQLSYDYRWDLRGAVCEQLGELSGLSEQEVDAIIVRMLALTDDKNWHVKRAAWRTLSRLDLSAHSQVKVLGHLKNQIKVSDKSESQIKAGAADRELAYRAFAIISWKEDLKVFIQLPIFLQWLQEQIILEPNKEVYIVGLQLMKTFLPDNDLLKENFFSILKPVQTIESSVRREAIYELIGTVEWPESIMKTVAITLICGIDDRVRYVGRAACKSLINLSWPNPPSTKLVEYFLDCLRKHQSLAPLREYACMGLGKLVLSSLDHPNYSLVFDTIFIRTTDDIPSVRRAAWKTLTKYPCSFGMQVNIFVHLQYRSRNLESPWHLLMDSYQMLGEFPWSKEFKAQAHRFISQAMQTINDPFISAIASQSLALLSAESVVGSKQSKVKISSFWDRFFKDKVELPAPQPVNDCVFK